MSLSSAMIDLESREDGDDDPSRRVGDAEAICARSREDISVHLEPDLVLGAPPAVQPGSVPTPVLLVEKEPADRPLPPTHVLMHR